MHTHYFYSSEISPEYIVLDEEETRHCRKVYRHVEGNEIQVMDGKGRRYTAKIETLDRKKLTAKIVTAETLSDYRPYQLVVAMCLLKNMSRWELFLEKAVELGVSGIIPLVSDRTLKPSVKERRLQHIILSACKQSQQFFMPKLFPVTRLKDLLCDHRWENHTRCIAHVQSDARPWLTRVADNGPIIVAIGPEGDFTRKEVDIALQSGWNEVSLGDQRLRTETAGILTCSALYTHHQ